MSDLSILVAKFEPVETGSENTQVAFLRASQLRSPETSDLGSDFQGSGFEQALSILSEAEIFGSDVVHEPPIELPTSGYLDAVAEWVMFLSQDNYNVVGEIQGNPWEDGAVAEFEVTKPEATRRAGTKVVINFKKTRAQVLLYQTGHAYTVANPQGSFTVRWSKTREGQDVMDAGGNLKPLAQAITKLLILYVPLETKTRRSKLYRENSVHTTTEN